MWTMGDDFQYQYAESWFKQMDKLIHYVNKVEFMRSVILSIFCYTWDYTYFHRLSLTMLSSNTSPDDNSPETLLYQSVCSLSFNFHHPFSVELYILLSIDYVILRVVEWMHYILHHLSTLKQKMQQMDHGLWKLMTTSREHN